MSSQQIRYGSKSALDVQPFNEGNLYFVQDGNKTDLYADLEGERTRVTDIVFNNIFDLANKKCFFFIQGIRELHIRHILWEHHSAKLANRFLSFFIDVVEP